MSSSRGSPCLWIGDVRFISCRRDLKRTSVYHAERCLMAGFCSCVAVLVQTEITADAVEPGVEAFRRMEHFETPPGDQQRLLGHVFRCVRRNALEPRQAEQAWSGQGKLAFQISG